MDKIITLNIEISYIVGVIFVSLFLCLSLLISLSNVNKERLRKSLMDGIRRKINQHIYREDQKIIAKLYQNNFFSKLDLFLSDIKVDTDIFRDSTLYQFKLIIRSFSLLAAIIIGLLVFKNPIAVIICFPFSYFIIIAFLFFNIVNKKRQRLIDIINTENLLSIEMERGFNNVVADNLNNIPISIRQSYKDYLINTTALNFTSEDALQKLKLELGTYSWEFLDKVNLYENYRETDTDSDIFKDIVVLNQIRLRGYKEVYRIIKAVKASFWISLSMSAGLLLLELLFIKAVRWFYFSFIIGQALLLLNITLIVIIILRLNVLAAEEL